MRLDKGALYTHSSFITSIALSTVICCSASLTQIPKSPGIARTTEMMNQPCSTSASALYLALACIMTMAAMSAGQCTGWGDLVMSPSVCPPDNLLNGATVLQVAAGSQHAVALTSNHQIICWGETMFNLTKPPRTDSKDPPVAIASGRWHSLALLKSGRVVCWGDDSFKQCSGMPKGMKGIKQIAAGSTHSCALLRTGQMKCWGSNMYGESTVPASAASNVISIACGRVTSIAVLANGKTVQFGFFSQGSSSASQQRVVKQGANPPVISNCIQCAIGNNFAMCVQKDGSLTAWTSNPSRALQIPKALSQNVVSVTANLMGPDGLVLFKDGSTAQVMLCGNDFPYTKLCIDTKVPKAAQSNVHSIACGSGFYLTLHR